VGGGGRELALFCGRPIDQFTPDIYEVDQAKAAGAVSMKLLSSAVFAQSRAVVDVSKGWGSIAMWAEPASSQFGRGAQAHFIIATPGIIVPSGDC